MPSDSFLDTSALEDGFSSDFRSFLTSKEKKQKKTTAKSKLRSLKSLKTKQQDYMKTLDARKALEYRYGLIPRILKSDARRNYAAMFANVYNSCDYEYMMEFLKTFYREDLILIMLQSGKIVEIRNQACELHGIKPCGDMWFERMHDAPDLLFELTSQQMKLRADNSAVISAEFELSGSKFVTQEQFELKTERTFDGCPIGVKLREESLTDSSTSDSLTTKALTSDSFISDNLSIISTASTTSSSFSDFEYSSHQDSSIVIQKNEVSSNIDPTSLLPFQIKVGGKLSLHLDEDSKVFLLELNFYL